MHSQGNFTKSSLANKFDELVEVESGGRQFIVFLNVLLYVLYKLVSFLEDGVVNPCLRLFVAYPGAGAFVC